MHLPSGTRLGPYKIEAPIGAGGMGEVYRATDTRLKRDVAVKVLSSGLTAEPGAKQRFEREAHSRPATLPGNSTITPLVVTHPKSPSRKSFVCHTSETPGVWLRSLWLPSPHRARSPQRPAIWSYSVRLSPFTHFLDPPKSPNDSSPQKVAARKNLLCYTGTYR